MRLYSSATSPFVRKVLVLIREAGISGVDLVPAAGTPVAPGTMPVDHNPLGKIPALVLDDGRTLFD
ncbi:MAG: glutathione S-transferase N-terminal domain-containing protein, partial [Paracoccaceae bacterium]